VGGGLVTVRSEYLQLGFGLDEASGLQNPQPGRLIACQNVEVLFGEAGVRRCAGYERLDGKAAPSDATYYIVRFTGGNFLEVNDNSSTSGGGACSNLRVQIDSGTFGTYVGRVIVTAVTGNIAVGQTIDVGPGVGIRTATISHYDEGDPSSDNYATDIALARTHYRNLITKPGAQTVSGYGPLRGVAILNGRVLALRDDDDTGYSATLSISGVGGWGTVRAGLRGGGYLQTVVANFTGDDRTRKLYGVDGKNRLWSYDGTSFEFSSAVYTNEALVSHPTTPGNSIVPAGGAQSFTAAEFNNRTWASGDVLLVYGRTNAANWMIGTFTSYGSPTLTINVTSFNNDGGEQFYYVCLADESNRPYLVAEHKGYLMLAFPNGQLQTSDLGSPMTYGFTSNGSADGAATATAFGIGDEIKALQPVRGDILSVLGENKVHLLYGDGSDATPWQMRKHGEISNTRLASSVNVAGDAVYVSDAGLLTLSGSQDFGDFGSANVATAARRTQRDICSDYRCTVLAKNDSQLRIYGKDMQALVMTFAGAVNRKSIAFTKLVYLHQATCAASETNDDGEIVVFGTDDGWVMRDRVGTTFDGEPIEAYIRTSYWHNGAPHLKKRQRKLTIDVDPQLGPVTLQVYQDFDFNGPDAGQPYTYSELVAALGGRYDSASWDGFFFDGADAGQIHLPVDGVGRFMSVVILSNGDTNAYVLRGINDLFSPLGLAR
jgi:hypothetical protein